jgi:hypothetical protein
MPVDKENAQNEDRNPAQQLSGNGIVTVNDANNPTQEERDSQIGAEPNTERLRSERESVQEGQRNSRH